jgi:putative transposase
MGRPPRVDVGDLVYHVINRANFHFKLFSKDKQYREFLDILEEAQAFVPMRLLAYCLMPNHWHLVLYPRNEGDLSKFMHYVTLTHTQRFHAKTKTIGYGHIYQGRYKSLPVGDDRYFLTLVRYVERNAKRAAFVKRAEDWKWSSAHIRFLGTDAQKKLLYPWPVEEPDDYREFLNRSEPKEEVETIRYAIKRNKPYGSDEWTEKIIKKFGLESTVHDPWRPKKGT